MKVPIFGSWDQENDSNFETILSLYSVNSLLYYFHGQSWLKNGKEEKLRIIKPAADLTKTWDPANQLRQTVIFFLKRLEQLDVIVHPRVTTILYSVYPNVDQKLKT